MKIVEVVDKFNLLIKGLAEKKEEFCNNPGKDFSRKRKQDFEQIIRSILSLDGGALTNEILRIHKYSSDSPSASAFIQQRAKLSETAFPNLFRTINKTFDKDCRYEGYRMIAVDGSHIHVPNNPDDQDSYVCSRENEHFHNEFHLNAFWDILQGTFIDVILQKYRTQNEDQALIDMVERSELKDAIIVCDRGYEAYNNMAHLQEKGFKYVIRIKEIGSYGIADGLDIPKHGEFDLSINLSLTRKRDQNIKELVKERNKYKYIPNNSRFDYLAPSKRTEPAVFFYLDFRILSIKISEDDYEMIVTNLPADKFPPERIKEIYGMRWGIENSFRDLKYIVGLLRFHSKKSSFVTQEIYANLIMHNMTIIIIACEKITKKKTKHIYKIRFSTAANIVKRLLAGDASPPAAEVLIQRNLSPVRPNRSYPRKKTPLKASIQFVYRIA